MTALVAVKSYSGMHADIGDEMPDRERDIFLRPSSYANWSLCPDRVLLSTAEGYDNRSNEPPGWGTGAHAVIGHFLKTGEMLDVQGVLDLWANDMASRDPSEDIRSYASAATLWALATELKHAFEVWLEGFWTTKGSLGETVAVEETVLRPLGVLVDRIVWVAGTPDRVAKYGNDLSIEDWKTAGQGWKKGKADANAVQLLCYAWLAEHHGPVEWGRFVVYDRKHGSWTWDETTFQVTPEKVERALRAMWQMARSIGSGIGVANPFATGGFGDGRGWHCSPKYCGAWNICDNKAIPNDGKDIEVRPSTMSWEKV